MSKEETLFGKAEQLLDHLVPELIEFRRDLHQHPELGWEEFRTTGKIESFLSSFTSLQLRKPLETGLVADLGGDPAKPLVLLRADIDALPIQDEKAVSYHSRTAGVCHACGHDVHTTVVVGTAALLAQLSDALPVNVRFVFQPAEEPIPSGAPRLIEKGVLEGVQNALGLHVEPSLPVGTVSLTSGWVNAQSIRLNWRVEGSGGHSARPHLAADPLWAGTTLVEQVYQLAYRSWNRSDFPVMITFTRFRAGEAYNAIPKVAELVATLRLTDETVRERIFADLDHLQAQIEHTSGVRFQREEFVGAPPVHNDPELVRRLQQNLTRWEDHRPRVTDSMRSMGGDDFGWYARAVPSVLVRFGAASGQGAAALHTGHFDVPDALIPLAVRFFTRQFLQW